MHSTTSAVTLLINELPSASVDICFASGGLTFHIDVYIIALIIR